MIEVWLTNRNRSILVATCNYSQALRHMAVLLRLGNLNAIPTTVTLLACLDGRLTPIQCRCCV